MLSMVLGRGSLRGRAAGKWMFSSFVVIRSTHGNHRVIYPSLSAAEKRLLAQGLISGSELSQTGLFTEVRMIRIEQMNTPSDPEVLKDRSYWVVSPNVKNNERTVSDWRQASVREHAAFMGWF